MPNGGAVAEIIVRYKRESAANFQKEIQKFMKRQGFLLGKYKASTSFHAVRGLKVMVHKDDFFGYDPS